MTIYQDNSAVARGGRAAMEWMAAWRTAASDIVETIWAHRRKRQTYSALMNLDNRTLKDIGLDRSEIMSISYGDRSCRSRRNLDR